MNRNALRSNYSRHEILWEFTECLQCLFFLEPFEVGYEFNVYTATEGVGFVELCAVVINHLDGAPKPLAIDATTEDGVAGTISISQQIYYTCMLLCYILTSKFSLYSYLLSSLHPTVAGKNLHYVGVA